MFKTSMLSNFFLAFLVVGISVAVPVSFDSDGPTAVFSNASPVAGSTFSPLGPTGATASPADHPNHEAMVKNPADLQELKPRGIVEDSIFCRHSNGQYFWWDGTAKLKSEPVPPLCGYLSHPHFRRPEMYPDPSDSQPPDWPVGGNLEKRRDPLYYYMEQSEPGEKRVALGWSVVYSTLNWILTEISKHYSTKWTGNFSGNPQMSPEDAKATVEAQKIVRVWKSVALKEKARKKAQVAWQHTQDAKNAKAHEEEEKKLRAQQKKEADSLREAKEQEEKEEHRRQKAAKKVAHKAAKEAKKEAERKAKAERKAQKQQAKEEEEIRKKAEKEEKAGKEEEAHA